MSELKKYKLGDLGFFFGGVTTIGKEDYGHGTPFLPYKNVYKNSKVNVNELELMNIRPQDIERRSAKYGDIFFTASSETPDEVAMSSVLLDDIENLTYNGFCKRYRLNDFSTLLPKYARYLFRDINFRREVYQVATGDIRFNISQESLAKIEIEIPDVAKQAQLAEILMKLDDKIELNLQMNQTLQAMAQALFKEWFVNFNFPKFKGVLENSLPKGWRIGKVGEMVDVKGGTTPSTTKEEYWNGEFYWTTPKDLSNIQAPILIDTERKITELGVKQISSGVMPKGTLLLSSRAPIGYIAISQVPISINQGYIAIQGKLVSNLFMLFWLKLNMDAVKSKANGSTFQEISKSNFKEIETIIPSSEILKQFDAMANPIFDKIVENVFQIQTLTQTRDTLLPKLMSGEIEIKN
jgi:type I restriction enzyme, S subunit